MGGVVRVAGDDEVEMDGEDFLADADAGQEAVTADRLVEVGQGGGVAVGGAVRGGDDPGDLLGGVVRGGDRLLHRPANGDRAQRRHDRQGRHRLRRVVLGVHGRPWC